MDGVIIEWLAMAVRWFHVVAAIAWIGASFYFIWLDLSLRSPPQWKADLGIKGDLWAIHGGGIYEVAKYHSRPQTMPTTLHWFKWEAYSTWLSGSLLLMLVYYLQAQTYLVGFNTWVQSPSAAVAASISLIVGAQLTYELLMRTPLVKHGLAFGFVLLLLITLASWLAHQLFSARAAYLHVGAIIATWMAGNVFWGIMPAQRKFVAAVEKNLAPDMQAMAFAKLRSTHNNYLTLPVIFCMVSNHYPFLYGHYYGWIGLVAIGLLLAWGRHYFNLKHLGHKKPSILLTSAAGFIAVALVLSLVKGPAPVNDSISQPLASTADEAGSLSTSALHDLNLLRVNHLVSVHCHNCHAQKPTQAGFPVAPAGLIISDADQLRLIKVRAAPALQSGYMPLGNFEMLSTEERNFLLAWLNQQ